ncbi:GDSL-type esterase/lipase family protein [Roseomonas sp. CCTCC AB2023176]|uniref:GDSL-type esterase/lipase family protein n=1 Tax=Roseomonas sp. CCTCC AB2023176 TaxID=3342640 RepID=UPI0035E37B78
MSRLGGLLLAVALSLTGTAAVAQTACPAIPPRNPIPKEAVPTNLDEPQWRARVAELQRVTAGDLSRVQVAFLGDSLTQGWFPLIFEQFYGGRSALNLGVGGDFTQGLLWRITQGGHWPASLRPRVAVLLIGTNNAAFADRAEDTALGVAEVIRAIRARSPTTKILLVGLLPRGADGTDAARQMNRRVNALIARCADNVSVFWTDPGPMLTDPSGRLSEQMSYDRLHLTMVGYAILAAGLEPSIRALLGEPTSGR